MTPTTDLAQLADAVGVISINLDDVRTEVRESRADLAEVVALLTRIASAIDPEGDDS